MKNCPQLVIYLVLSLISIITSFFVINKFHENKNKTQNMYVHIIVMMIMSLLFYWLCENNHHTIAWILLFLPVILILFIVTMLYIAYGKKHHRKHPPHGHWR